MATLTSIISYDLSCRRRLGSHRRSQSSVCNQHRLLAISTPKSNKGGLSLLSIRHGSSESKSKAKMNMAVYCSPVPPTTPPSASSPWKSCLLGVLVMAMLPFCKQKWHSFVPIIRDVDKVIEGAERAADFVEKVASDVEKVADEVADELPGKGKVEDIVRHVEDIAKETAKDAEIAEKIIQKVEELEHEVEKDIKSTIDKKNVVLKENKNSKIFSFLGLNEKSKL